MICAGPALVVAPSWVPLERYLGVQGWAVVVRVGWGVLVVEVEVVGVLLEAPVAEVPAVEPGTLAGPSGWTVRVGHGGGTELTVSWSEHAAARVMVAVMAKTPATLSQVDRLGWPFTCRCPRRRRTSSPG